MHGNANNGDYDAQKVSQEYLDKRITQFFFPYLASKAANFPVHIQFGFFFVFVLNVVGIHFVG